MTFLIMYVDPKLTMRNRSVKDLQQIYYSAEVVVILAFSNIKIDQIGNNI